MAEWKIKISGVSDEVTRLIIDFEIYKDNKLAKKETVNLEGDVIDVGLLKTRILRQLKKLEGMDKKANMIRNLLGKQLTPNEDFSDILVM